MRRRPGRGTPTTPTATPAPPRSRRATRHGSPRGLPRARPCGPRGVALRALDRRRSRHDAVAHALPPELAGGRTRRREQIQLRPITDAVAHHERAAPVDPPADDPQPRPERVTV